MKKITSILSLVIVLAMAFSMTAFAAGANEFTITTEVDSVSAGDTVIVNVDASGDWMGVAMTQFSIDFDETLFSVDTEIDWDVEYEACWDYDWYDEINATAGKKLNLTRISAPAPGVKDGMFNVIYLSTKGTSLTAANSTLAVNGGTTTVARVKFTALADVAAIDASCFELKNVKVEESDGTAHAITVNQIESEEPAPSVNMVSTTEIVDVQKADTVEGEATDYQYGSAIGISGTTDGAIFKKMIWAITVGSDRLYSEAFDVSLEGDFKVAATFINGNKVDDNNVAFSDAGAIFTDGVEDYFTNDADAANKEKAE